MRFERMQAKPMRFQVSLLKPLGQRVLYEQFYAIFRAKLFLETRMRFERMQAKPMRFLVSLLKPLGQRVK